MARDNAKIGDFSPRGSPCCMPSKGVKAYARANEADRAPGARRGRLRSEAVLIPGGRSAVGTDRPVLIEDGEGPMRQTRIADFAMSPTVVSKGQFGAFIAATGYVTDAERLGWSFVFHLLPPDSPSGSAQAPWWRRVDGASWDRPFGPRSLTEDCPDHPVVQVSWNDATAYARWAGGRLPNEAEWEHAARGGLKSAVYPWGDEAPDERTFLPANIWQGVFPHHDTGADGFAGLAPARSFAPNGYGLYNMVGNCWQWTAEPFRIRSLRRDARVRNAEALAEARKLLKGGSFLCHASYCHRYRIAARSGNTPESATGHIGFRVAFDI